MADYRLSAQVIKRSDGKSSVASAAYRAAVRLEDQRTGEIHNYAPKGGVEHAQILAPDNTPSWMLNRQDLWNAVEKIERRKDAQLAREIQLSLPHELTPEQRRELVLGFVKGQFVDNGMIADIAIHSPNPKGDERNHHAHIMLTMRELTSDGFGKKNRDWNSRETVNRWREEWAEHQNRTLERLGHDARVDHRSLEDQGIDREPQMHLGVIATDIERNGNSSRKGDKNRAMDERNDKLAVLQAEAARIATEITKERAKIQQAQRIESENLKEKDREKNSDLKKLQDRKRRQLEADLKTKFHDKKQFEQKKLLELREKVQDAKGFKKFFRDISGLTRKDITLHNEIRRSLLNIRAEERKERFNLELSFGREKKKYQEKREIDTRDLEAKQKKDREKLDPRQQAKNRENSQARSVSRQEQPMPRPKPPRGAASAPRSWQKPKPAQDNKTRSQPELEPQRDASSTRTSWKKTNSKQEQNSSFERPDNSRKGQKIPEAKRSWQRDTPSNDNDRPSPSPPDRGRDREP